MTVSRKCNFRQYEGLVVGMIKMFPVSGVQGWCYTWSEVKRTATSEVNLPLLGQWELAQLAVA